MHVCVCSVNSKVLNHVHKRLYENHDTCKKHYLNTPPPQPLYSYHHPRLPSQKKTHTIPSLKLPAPSLPTSHPSPLAIPPANPPSFPSPGFPLLCLLPRTPSLSQRSGDNLYTLNSSAQLFHPGRLWSTALRAAGGVRRRYKIANGSRIQRTIRRLK